MLYVTHVAESQSIRIICILCTPRPIYRSTYRPILDRYINRDIGRVMVDISADYRQLSRSIFRPTLARYVDHSLSAEYRSTVGGISVDCLIIYVKSIDCQCQKYRSYKHFNLFWSTSKISDGFMLGSCAANSIVVKQDTQVKYCQIHKIRPAPVWPCSSVGIATAI